MLSDKDNVAKQCTVVLRFGLVKVHLFFHVLDLSTVRLMLALPAWDLFDGGNL